MRSNRGWNRNAWCLALLWIALPGCDAESPAETGKDAALAVVSDPGFDVGIVTVIAAEYEAMLAHMDRTFPVETPGSRANAFAWIGGEFERPGGRAPLRVIIAMAGEAGTSSGALAVMQTAQTWKPEVLVLAGIAGGLPPAVGRGDVVISEAVWGYEYGAVDASFRPRFDWVFQSDRRLAGIAVNYAGNWQKDIQAEKPDDHISPRHLAGITASGNKVIETLESEFVERILGAFPGVVSVEMEGAGGLAAAELLAEGRDTPAVLMIRGISDIPNPKSGMFGDKRDRERWKRYAADCVAAFTAAFLRDAVDVTRRLPRPDTDLLLVTYTEGIFDALVRALATQPLETGQDSVELQVQARPFDRLLSVAIRKLHDRKNPDEFEESLARWRPDSVVLVDTALGTGSTSIGHVIAGRLVWPFEGEGTAVKARYVDSIRHSRALVGAAQAVEGTVFESDGSPIVLKSSTIAAGDDMPEWDDSDTIRAIDRLNPRTAVVDEESWRVAAHLHGRDDSERVPAFLSIQSARQRAGSDRYDDGKAAENAATVAVELVRSRWPYAPIAGN